jgi:cell division protein FtsI (penicillin-binding protein 3)
MSDLDRKYAVRSWILFSVLLLIGIGIFGKVIYIQSYEFERWQQQGQSFTEQVRSIKPSRGQIFSTNGSVLATSVPVYELRWDSQVEGLDAQALDAALNDLAQGFARIIGQRDAATYKSRLRHARQGGNRYHLVGRKLSYLQMKELMELPFIDRGRLRSGFMFIREDQRLKPFDELAARTVGIYRDSNRVGLEASWNEELQGVEGKQLQTRASGGVWIPATDDYVVEPQNGFDVVSTIDMHLQDVASRALEKQLVAHNAAWGTVVLMEVATGRIRAIANLTRHGDGSDLAGEAPKYYESYNHAIGSAVEPGSTFKLATLMAAMEAGVAPETVLHTGNGRVVFHGKAMHDSNHEQGGHGDLTLEEAFEVSSNVGTALAIKQAFDAEPQALLDALAALGVSEPTGIRLAGEAQPKVYSEVGEGRWSALSLTQMAIGYEVTQTPLQTLSLFNAIANDGRVMEPQLVEALMSNGRVTKRFEPRALRDGICSEATLAACRRMMERVADPEGNGTANAVFKRRPYRVAGKTGTAWIAGPNGYDGRYRASFAGYFPAEAPKYSCIVVVADTRSGQYYGSTIAGPVFRELADKVYATDPSLHPATEGNFAEAPHLPGAKDGATTDLLTLYDAWGVNYLETERLGDWARAHTHRDSVLVSPLPIPSSAVPDVRGLGLRDALYLLENAGLIVTTNGIGTVRHQSITPGTALRSSRTIHLELS